MTYIETIKRGSKTYYYLTKNLRININKWKKIRIYLGNKKPPIGAVGLFNELIYL